MDYPLYYRLDASDRITQTGGEWDAFAGTHDGASLRGDAVLGHSLYDFVQGDVSRMFVRTLVDGVRLLQRSRTVGYRCDSPGLKRFMEMTLAPLAGGEVLVSHRQLRTEPVTRAFHFQVVQPDQPGVVVRCTHCNAVKRQGRWGEAETVLPVGLSRVPVIYGVCESCLAAVIRR